MKKAERTFVFFGLIGLCFFLFHSIDLAEAKDPAYPTKPINFYIGMGAGGLHDLSCRVIANAASKHLGQPFAFINKAGAGGSLAAMAVITAKPDGYALGGISTSAIVAPFFDESPYKDLSGLTMIANFGQFINPVVVRTDAPWKTWKELVEYARKNPNAVKIGITSAKVVSNPGFLMWQVEKKENIEFAYVPFKSGAEIVSALLGGHIAISCASVDASLMSWVKEGKLRLLAFMETGKMPGYENLPSLQDMYGLVNPNVSGVWGPKGLPDYVVKKLDDAFAKAIKDPDFIGVMNQLQSPILYMNSAQMTKHIDDLFPKVGEKYKLLKAEEKAKEKK